MGRAGRLAGRGWGSLAASRRFPVNAPGPFRPPLPLKGREEAIADGKLDAKKPIDAAALLAAGVIRRELDGVRLLGKGELKSKLNITVYGASAPAIAAVEKAGGSVTVTAPPVSDEPKGKL